ncbi:MAG: PilZ domain-containing protein [Vulcanimicrobiota bacterium]
MTDTADRRDCDRIPVAMNAWVRSAGCSSFNRIRALDVSSGGLRLQTDQSFPTGRELHVTLCLDSRQHVTFSARPVWHLQGQVGLAFEPTQAREAVALRKWHLGQWALAQRTGRPAPRRIEH